MFTSDVAMRKCDCSGCQRGSKSFGMKKEGKGSDPHCKGDLRPHFAV